MYWLGGVVTKVFTNSVWVTPSLSSYSFQFPLDNYFSILPLKQINEVGPRNWTGPYYESLAEASDD